MLNVNENLTRNKDRRKPCTRSRTQQIIKKKTKKLFDKSEVSLRTNSSVLLIPTP